MSTRITPIEFRKFDRILKSFGFVPMRKTGSHISYTKKDIKRPGVVPVHGKMIPVLIILSNLKTAGISREEYLNALSRL